MKFKKRYLVYAVLLGYLLFAHSCMTMRTSAKKTRAFFKEQRVAFLDSTVQIQDRDLHYLQTGNEKAQSLVFIHGSPGSWDAWKNYLTDSLLLKKYRLIAPDRPGFGYSDFRRSLNLDVQATIMNNFLKKIDNGKPITLIGHSYGGPLIVKMALENPDLYQNLMILAGAIDPSTEKPEKWRKPLTWVPLKYLVPGSLKPSNDELWMLKQDLIAMRPDLKYLSQNVMIIHGTADNLVPYKNVDFMKQAFSNVDNLEVITLKDENHFIVWDKEQLIKDNLLDFLSK
ncbi:alpha/beta fold hydrolase [Croceitalea sp. MTPC9]|uniref:alpha/beta fold hydrolase n=1 Tax=unclassified Croceitalea TaxID=2632280 RepID=UPI002B3746D6|nr:alpha/beta fold hydrolase [Croceitalea sp. MTPC6]GMN15650.1 alpha/beta fold hydrolase [Croceitalea sp. MTPC9]